jgi:hypothetical protein
MTRRFHSRRWAVVAAVCTLILPGLGSVVQGQVIYGQATQPGPSVTVQPVPPPVPQQQFAPQQSFAPQVLVPLYGAAQVDQLTSTIALYPDPLLAIVLQASLTPSDVQQADFFFRTYGQVNPGIIDLQPWAPAVKSLSNYPAALAQLAGTPGYVQALGYAWANQPADVVASIQRWRYTAQLAGTLYTTAQQVVVFEPGVIRIVPAVPTVVYVPTYEPQVVYVRQRVQHPQPIRFSIGFNVCQDDAPRFRAGWDWSRRDWHPDGFRPAGRWGGDDDDRGYNRGGDRGSWGGNSRPPTHEDFRPENRPPPVVIRPDRGGDREVAPPRSGGIERPDRGRGSSGTWGEDDSGSRQREQARPREESRPREEARPREDSRSREEARPREDSRSREDSARDRDAERARNRGTRT